MSKMNVIMSLVIARVCVVITVLSTMCVQIDAVITVQSTDAQPVPSNC